MASASARKPVFSVIVPTRNETANIPRFLTAVPGDVELVVADASDDETPHLIRRLRPQNTQVIPGPGTIAAARQAAALASHGTWLVFSDADVIFAPDYFQILTRAVQNQRWGAYYGPKHSTGAYAGYGRLFGWAQRSMDRVGLAAASGSNLVVARDAFAAVDGFRTFLPVNEDTDLGLRLRHAGIGLCFRPDLVVVSVDDRRLRRGVVRKSLHSLCRGLLLWVDLRMALPRPWLASDWSYWRSPQASVRPSRTSR